MLSTESSSTVNGPFEPKSNAGNVVPAPKKQGPKQNRKGGASSEAFIFCLEAGHPEGGKIQLSKPAEEDEILGAAFKTGVSFYKLQKFNATTEKTSDHSVKIVGTPVE